MKVHINETGGIIIVDVVLRTSLGAVSNQLELPVAMEKLEFRFADGSVSLIDIGTTSYTPTVRNNVKSLVFDPEAEMLDVLDETDDSVLSVSTNNREVLVRVNFATSTITIYEE
jgi:hypothetical protein